MIYRSQQACQAEVSVGNHISEVQCGTLLKGTGERVATTLREAPAPKCGDSLARIADSQRMRSDRTRREKPLCQGPDKLSVLKIKCRHDAGS